MSLDRAFSLVVFSSCTMLLLLGMRLNFHYPKTGVHFRRFENERTGDTTAAAMRQSMDEHSLVDVEGRKLPSKIFAWKDDKYFLYGELLDMEHSFNRSNMISFKKEFLHEPGRKFNNFIADQNNTEVGSRIPYYLSPKQFFNVTEEFHNRLPKVANLSGLRTCTVVGNSGILLNSSCGHNIDRSDFVFRCNAAPLKLFVKDAGGKSNITTFNPSIFIKRYHGIKKTEHIRQFRTDMEEYTGYLLASCFGASAFMPLCLKALKSYSSSKNTLATALPDFFKNITNVWKKRGLTGRISTGFYLTMAALHFCEKVHIYGFWPFPVMSSSDEAQAVPYHYYDAIDFPSNNKNNHHDMNKEFGTLLRLHALGILQIHVATCS